MLTQSGFSGRTQELIYVLHELYKNNEVPKQPIYSAKLPLFTVRHPRAVPLPGIWDKRGMMCSSRPWGTASRCEKSKKQGQKNSEYIGQVVFGTYVTDGFVFPGKGNIVNDRLLNKKNQGPATRAKHLP